MVRNVAVIILFDKDKKILLQHHADNLRLTPGYWAFFGGPIEDGETPEQAVKREALEELEYPLSNPKLIMKQNFLSHGDNNEKYVFMEEYDLNKKITLGEGQDLGWYALPEATQLKIFGHDLEVLKYIANKY
ncbi:MAG: NUDIX domain-containing protein [Patescibacteria group bacterium]|nr:NUDIX domain-containing protein [Patescibacteria group bacterium]